MIRRRTNAGWAIYWVIIGLLAFLADPGMCATDKSDSSDIFQKYTYKSNYSDSELFQSTYTGHHLDLLRNETRNLFYYAFDRYMEYGYPYDEVKPISCVPHRRNRRDYKETARNDVMGNFTLTLLDNLDTFVIMGDQKGFEAAVERVKHLFTKFDIDSTVQVFETNIRILGGLLSAHLYAVDPRKGHSIEGYDGFLLRLAYDLGKRLAIAFDNDIDDQSKFNGDIPLIIPYPRTNLLKGPEGVPWQLQAEQCTSGVTSFVVEFSMLSRLTGDHIFEDISRYTLLRIWDSRTEQDLIPMTIRTKDFTFTDSLTGVGASIDSFYEYALKYSILFDDEQFFRIWAASYRSLLINSQNGEGFFPNVNVNSGLEISDWIDALGGFFPGLQALAGDIPNAILSHRIYLKLWNYYGAIPERWNHNAEQSEPLFEYLKRPYRNGDLLDGYDQSTTDEFLLKNSVALEWYPLRPEFVESTYYLYQATKDPLYLRIGEAFLKRFRSEFIAPCGFGGVLDVRTGARQDRMESFVLGETLKYLYLLFDVENELHTSEHGSTNTIFSTEAHPLWYDRELVKSYSEQVFKLRKDDRSLYKGETQVKNNRPRNLDRLKGMFTATTSEQYAERLENAFKQLKSHFYGNVANDWKEVYVTDNVHKLLLQRNLGNMTVGERIFVHSKLYKKLAPLAEGMEYYNENAWWTDRLPKSLTDRYNVDSDYLSLAQCSVSQSHEQQFVYSHVFSTDRSFYKSDFTHQMSLRRPPYLPNSENVELELDDTFYRRFTQGKPTCLAPADTTVFGAVMKEPVNEDRGARIVRLTNKQDHSRAGIYIDDLSSFRAVFEKEQSGDLNVYNEYVTAEAEVLRVLKFNGYRVGRNESVWVNLDSNGLHKMSGISCNEDGIVEINQVPVINMRTIAK